MFVSGEIIPAPVLPLGADRRTQLPRSLDDYAHGALTDIQQRCKVTHGNGVRSPGGDKLYKSFGDTQIFLLFRLKLRRICGIITAELNLFQLVVGGLLFAVWRGGTRQAVFFYALFAVLSVIADIAFFAQ